MGGREEGEESFSTQQFLYCERTILAMIHQRTMSYFTHLFRGLCSRIPVLGTRFKAPLIIIPPWENVFEAESVQELINQDTHM